MTQTITYHSNNAPAGQEWMAYAVLPNGQRWNVYSMASTEAEAINKIVSLYESEIAKNKTTEFVQVVGRADRSHHFAGKVWMIHSFTRAKQRVNPDEVAKYEAEGWVKGGPRSK